MDGDRMLVNFFYAQPVGHAVEALHYAHGHAVAVPGREVSLALNAATATELAGFCPFVSATYAIQHPFLEPCPDSASRLRSVPRDWDWIVDDTRRYQPLQYELFPGMRDYYAASDTHLRAGVSRSVVGAERAGYRPHQPLRLELPATARRAAVDRLSSDHAPAARIAVMPAGSSDASRYPSAGSWSQILDALADAFTGVQVVLLGRTAQDERTSTALSGDDLAELRRHRSGPVDCFDVPLGEQLAVVEACDVFLAPHTGFGLAALAVGTPWLSLSGGRWFEYYFNHVPFRSVLPDPDRYPSFSQFDPAQIIIDGEEGPRTPSMTRARIREDLDRIVAAAQELVAGTLPYERALSEYFAGLKAVHRGDTSAIWSIDSVHLGYV
ncbi:glycosyltransferase family protein [Modestobacter lapidis]|nr:glycosyltransferase family 9 protein [Modestobacter lapidis]